MIKLTLKYLAIFTVFGLSLFSLNTNSLFSQDEKKPISNNNNKTLTDEEKKDEERLTPEMRNLREMFHRRSLERFEKGGKGKIENLDRYITIFKEAILDKKIWVCNINAASDKKKIKLSGEVNASEFKSGLENVLKELGFTDIQNNIKVMPFDTLPDTPYGFVTSAAAWMYRDPDLKSEPLNQSLYGSPVRLLKMSDDKKFYLIQSSDAYIGYMESSNLMPVSVNTYSEYQKKNSIAVFNINTKIIINTEKNSEMDIKVNTFLPFAESKISDTKIPVILPDNQVIEISKDALTLYKPDFMEQRIYLKKLSEEVMNSDYKWGGITKDGIDCSGFTQYIYKRVGLNLPRDADEQASMGRVVAYNDSIEGLIPGDLLFFISRNGRIGHVALSLGGTEYVHASSPKVQYGSFDPKSDKYDEKYRRIIYFAKRIFNNGFPIEK